jgi:expansin (peptidoglycan-binding protein)
MQTVIACQNTYAASGDCSFAAINTYDTTCAGIATTTDGGNALSAACVKAFEQNPGICASDAGS